MVEPEHPLQRGDFYRPLGLPRGSTMDQFCPVQTIHRFRQGVVVDVSFTAYLGRNVDLAEMPAVANGDVLGTLVGMVDQSRANGWKCTPDGVPGILNMPVLRHLPISRCRPGFGPAPNFRH